MIQPKRKMHLTAEHVAKVQRVEADEGPRPHLQQLNDADYAELAAELVRLRRRTPAAGLRLWLADLET